jgi:hypothetical protein
MATRPETRKYHSSVLTASQLRAIGVVAVESAQLELTLELLIRQICGMDMETGRLFTDSMQLSTKLRTLRELVKDRIAKDDEGECRRLFDRIADLIPKRNTIIHGEWWPPELIGTATPEAVRLRRGKDRIPNVKASDVLSIGRHLGAAHTGLIFFVLKRWRSLAATM